jgi:predicted small secreted protein
MKKIKLTVLGFLIAVVSQMVFTACNTAHGFGEDMENAGQSIQEKTTGN